MTEDNQSMMRLARGPGASEPEPKSVLAAEPVKTLTKEDLIREVCLRCELPLRQGQTAVDTIFGSIIEALRSGDRVELRRFGVFSPHLRGPRRGRDPRSGAPVKVPSKSVGRFTPSLRLRRFIDGRPEE